MAKCFLTGVQIPLDAGYVLDIGATKRVLRELKDQVATIERLLQQLGPRDEVVVRDRTHPRGTYVRRDRRIVSPTVAMALGMICEEPPLFVKWSDWKSRCTKWRPSASGSDPVKSDAGEQATTAETVERHLAE